MSINNWCVFFFSGDVLVNSTVAARACVSWHTVWWKAMMELHRIQVTASQGQADTPTRTHALTLTLTLKQTRTHTHKRAIRVISLYLNVEKERKDECVCGKVGMMW